MSIAKLFLSIFFAKIFIFSAAAQGFMPWNDVLTLADIDRDGKVTKVELTKFGPTDEIPGFVPWMSDHWADLDADKDGDVSLDECRSGIEAAGWTDDEIRDAFYSNVGFMPRAQ
ncbi:MAG: hypothetical protein AAF387_15920 [Pseudomonadota bacterium]